MIADFIDFGLSAERHAGHRVSGKAMGKASGGVGAGDGLAAIKTMTDEIDIYRTANLLIRQHGAMGAVIHAAQRADELLAAGDMDGRRVWLKVLKAVKVISDASPPGGSAVVH